MNFRTVIEKGYERGRTVFYHVTYDEQGLEVSRTTATKAAADKAMRIAEENGEFIENDALREEEHPRMTVERLRQVVPYCTLWHHFKQELTPAELMFAHEQGMIHISDDCSFIDNKMNGSRVDIANPEERDRLMSRLRRIYQENQRAGRFNNMADTRYNPTTGSSYKSYDLAYDSSSATRRYEEFASSEPEVPVVLDVPVIWTNPKPKVLNRKAIKVGDRVLVSGHQLLLNVESIDVQPDGSNTLTLKQSDGGLFTGIPVTEAHPHYLQLDTSVVKVGNVVEVNGRLNPVIIKSIVESTFTDTLGSVHRIRDISYVYTKNRVKQPCTVYECGIIEYNGIAFASTDALREAFPTIDFVPEDAKIDYEIKTISSYYNVDVAELKPKEQDISATLKTTLEHPLNVAKKRWALLVGPSGSGKTEVALAFCEEVQREFVLVQGTAQLTVDDLIGYKSITTGEYVASLLRDAVENGKVFILDEIDACNPNTLLVLNSLKQSHYQFPDALVEIHKDFRVIGTANTLEYSEEYNARAPMDKATKARFKVIEYTMQPQELAVRYGFKYITRINNIERLTPREVEGMVLDMMIEDEAC